jgi:hypothetical protein
LPPVTLDRLAAVLGEHITPAWPVWAPLWKFPNRATQELVERSTDVILEQAGEPTWRITTTDTMRFACLEAVPVRTAARVA